MANDTPALCIPPNPNVSGWWWLVSPYKYLNIFFWCNISQKWSTSQNFNALPQYLTHLGYRIRGPIPSYAEVEKLRSTNAALSKKVSHYVGLLDEANGTPCEQIRHKQEIETLRTELSRWRNEAYKLSEMLTELKLDLDRSWTMP